MHVVAADGRGAVAVVVAGTGGSALDANRDAAAGVVVVGRDPTVDGATINVADGSVVGEDRLVAMSAIGQDAAAAVGVICPGIGGAESEQGGSGGGNGEKRFHEMNGCFGLVGIVVRFGDELMKSLQNSTPE